MRDKVWYILIYDVFRVISIYIEDLDKEFDVMAVS